MNTREAIRTRRSIRKFTGASIPEETVRDLLMAAMSAPSAANEQPWQFIVIDDRRLLDTIPTFSPYAAMSRHAPLAILVCGDMSEIKFPGFWIQDCAAATENLLLAAHDMKLGAVWTGVYPLDDRVKGFQSLLRIPEHIIPFAFVVLGQPAQVIQPENRFRENRIHRNGW